MLLPPSLLPPELPDLWKLVGHTVLPVAAKEVETWLKDTLYGKILSNNYSHPVVVRSRLGIMFSGTIRMIPSGSDSPWYLLDILHGLED